MYYRGILREYELERYDDFKFKKFKDWMLESLTIQKVKEYGIDTLPNLFEPRSVVNKFLEEGYLKPKVTSSVYFNILERVLKSDNFDQSLLNSFWLVFTVSFRPKLERVIKDLVNKLRDLNKSTTIIFLTSEYREELTLIFEFCLGYCVHLSMFEVFTHNTTVVSSPRFILNCYHIILFERRGSLVSDFYIQSQLQQIFCQESFRYLNQQERIKKKLKLNKSCSVFDTSSNNHSIGKFKGVNVQFPEFESIKNEMAKVRHHPAYSFYEKTRCNMIDYYEAEAEKAAQKLSRSPVPIKASQNGEEKKEDTVKSFTKHKKRRAESLGGKEVNPLPEIYQELGISKKKPFIYRIPFPCNKLSPAIESDLAASFKINLKPNLKKTINLTLIEDPSINDAKVIKSKVSQALASSSHLLKKAQLDSQSSFKSNPRKLQVKEATYDHVARNNGKIETVKDFTTGYEELIDMNDAMKQVSVEKVYKGLYKIKRGKSNRNSKK